MNAPITSLIQKSTQGGMKVQQPLLNVGGKSCGCPSDCDCGSPAKYGKNPAPTQFNSELKKAVKEGKIDKDSGFGKAITAAKYAPMKKKSCGYKK